MLQIIRHLKVSQRIIIGFIIMILLLIVVSANGLMNLTKLSDETAISRNSALAKYYTLLARHDASRYENNPTQEVITEVNSDLSEAINYATQAKELMSSLTLQETMTELVDRLNQFQSSFNNLVLLESEKAKASEARASAVKEADSYIQQIIGLQDSTLLNEKDLEGVKESFTTYKLAKSGYEDFIHARSKCLYSNG